ncbi:MAG: hypothetical protein ACTIJJ_03765 [Galactobacter sp.]
MANYNDSNATPDNDATQTELPYETAAKRSGWLKRGATAGLVALSLGGVGVGLAACSGAASANTGSSDSSQQSGTSSEEQAAAGQNGQAPDGQDGPFASIDTAAVADALGIDEDTLTEAIDSIQPQQGGEAGGGQGGTSGSTEGGAPGASGDGTEGSGSDAATDGSSGTDGAAPEGDAAEGDAAAGDAGEDPMVAALATALDLGYDDVLAALEDHGFTVGGPGAQPGQPAE